MKINPSFRIGVQIPRPGSSGDIVAFGHMAPAVSQD